VTMQKIWAQWTKKAKLKFRQYCYCTMTIKTKFWLCVFKRLKLYNNWQSVYFALFPNSS